MLGRAPARRHMRELWRELQSGEHAVHVTASSGRKQVGEERMQKRRMG